MPVVADLIGDALESALADGIDLLKLSHEDLADIASEQLDSPMLAVAAGALNVTRRGLGSGQRADIERLAEAVEVRPLATFEPRPARRATG